jgi:hypothetical protein
MSNAQTEQMTAAQAKALQWIRENFYCEIHKVVANDDGTLLLHHVGKGRERGTIRIRQWTMNLDGGLT